MDLDGAVVLVTGAARGLGAELARAFAAAGARVAAIDVLYDELDNTIGAIVATGGHAVPMQGDVTSPADVEAIVSRTEEGLGPIDVVVNNAGTLSVIAPVWEADIQRWYRDMMVNLYGSFLCCRAVAGRMVPRERGYILNIVSSGGVGDPHPYSTSYACAKTGLMRLTEGLAKELDPHGVKVFGLAPPAIRTAMTEFIMDDPGGKKWRPGFREIFDQGRDEQPEVVSELALQLVSGRADRLTGRFIHAPCDFDALVARTDEILQNDLLTLRLKT